jgi:hypothetical protein
MKKIIENNFIKILNKKERKL